MISHPFPDSFALDIGDLSIKLVQLKNVSLKYRHPTYEVQTARSTALPPGLIINGEIQQPEKVRKYIKHLLSGVKGESKPIKSRWVVASLPDTQSFLKLITLGKRQSDIIDEDIKVAAQKHIPFNENDYYIDWQVMPSDNTNTTNVLIGAAPKQIADMYTYLLESLGLGVIALEIEALATTRAMVTSEKKYEGEARALLDIGAARSTFIIHDNNHVQFTTSLPFSGEVFTMAISQKLHIPQAEAEQKKIHDGLLYERSQTWPIMSSLAEDLADHIAKSIRFYYSHFPSANNVTHITMCGGGSMMKGLDKVLSTKLKIDARPGRVWKNLFSHKSKLFTSEEHALSFATGIGLALRASDNPFFLNDLI